MYSSEDKSRWPSVERLRRWSQLADPDEIEIPIDQPTMITTMFDLIENSTLPDFQTTASNTTMLETFNEEIHSNITTTVIERVSDENTTVVYPFLLRDSFEINQTNISIIEDVLPDNQISTISNEYHQTNETNFQSSSSIITHVQSTKLLDLSENETLTTAATNEEWSIHSNLSLKDAIIVSQDIHINETEIIANATDIPIESSTSTAVPICDRSCECAKECPYGFEIDNDTCLCDPPCKVSIAGRKHFFPFTLFVSFFFRIINVLIMISVL